MLEQKPPAKTSGTGRYQFYKTAGFALFLFGFHLFSTKTVGMGINILPRLY
jgi:hypothetical protein